MKPFIDFKYQPHSSKAEDKKIRDWRKEHDQDDPRETRRLYYSGVLILFFATLCMAAITYLVWQYYPIIKSFGEFVDSLPAGFWCIFTVAVFVSLVLFWRGKKDRDANP